MPVSLYFSVWGEEEINRELLRFDQRSLDALPAFEGIGNQMRESIEKNFESEGRTGSGGWAPLKESTILEKARRNLDLRILHATLTMRNELVGEGEQWTAGPQSLTFVPSDDIFYGEFHMKGTVNMPQRKPVDFTALERTNWVKDLQRFIVTGAVDFV